MRLHLGDAVISASEARSSEELSKGLQGYKSLRPDEGMIFLFGSSKNPSFSMKSVSFPIDILGIDKDWCVNEVVPNVQPGTTKTYSFSSVIAVLELAGGAFSTSGAKIGDKIRIFGSFEGRGRQADGFNPFSIQDKQISQDEAQPHDDFEDKRLYVDTDHAPEPGYNWEETLGNDINTEHDSIFEPVTRQGQVARDIVVTIPKSKLNEIAREETQVSYEQANGNNSLSYFWEMGRLPKEIPSRIYFLWDGAVRAFHTVKSVDREQGRIYMDTFINNIDPVPMTPFRGFRYFDGFAPQPRTAQIVDEAKFCEKVSNILLSIASDLQWSPDTLTGDQTERCVVSREVLASYLNVTGGGDKYILDAASTDRGMSLIGDAAILAGIADIARVGMANKAPILILYRETEENREAELDISESNRKSEKMSKTTQRVGMPMPSGLPPGWKLIRTEDPGRPWNQAWFRIWNDTREIVAYILVEIRRDTWVVRQSDTEVDGYGAFLYQKVLEAATQEGATLESDYYVSDDAARVWDKFHTRQDVERIYRGPSAHHPGDEDEDYELGGEPRPEESLLYRYKMKV